jgi:hypothetical protein
MKRRKFIKSSIAIGSDASLPYLTIACSQQNETRNADLKADSEKPVIIDSLNY